MAVLDRFRLDGRTAVVTGASRGLGAAFALALAEVGANIVLIGRDGVAAQDVLGQVEARDAAGHVLLGDIRDREFVTAALDSAVERFGAVDVLINNAGTCIHKPALDVTDAEWRTVMETNVDALWICSQVFGGHMVERGRGSIVNIGSISGQIVNRPQWQPAYNTSKAAVHQLTKSLAAEWAPHGVRVNALAPGYIKTAMAPVDEPQYRRYWIEDAPQQRYATPEELGGAIVYLASDASSFVTGSVLVADGGYTIF
jgi:NAD(P)-dependent dehydrogenase (short-subunit alcohol dehydrogenase family)